MLVHFVTKDHKLPKDDEYSLCTTNNESMIASGFCPTA